MAKVNREKFKVHEGVFDHFTLDTLEVLKRKKYFDELKSAIKTGKEGDVYLAEKGEEFRAIKIFRLTSANFKKISQYINRDFRFKNVKGSLRKVILAWTQKEFRNLKICHKCNMNTPQPFKAQNNVIIMEYLPALMLKDTPLDNPKQFFNILKDQMRIMLNDAKLIHGDLSEFNILVKDQIPYIIDVGQAISIKNDSDFKEHYELFERDVRNVTDYMNKRYDLGIDKEELIKEIKNV